ncbi:MAG: C-terminal binding protein [Zavarzinella sp.]
MATPFRVVITDFIKDDLAPEKEILGDLATVEAFDATSEDQLAGKIESANGIMLYHSLSLTARTVQHLNECKLIVRCGVGYDNVDHALARIHNIPVSNVPDYGTEEVADSAIALMLALTRGVNYFNVANRDPAISWSYLNAAPLHRLRGQTFGMLGLGRIGTATALRAKAFGLKVVFYDPYTQSGIDKALGITRVHTLAELLPQSNILSIHAPLTPETHHMVGAAELAAMPKGSYLVNTARGAVVDNQAVLAAITSGHLAGAGLDVLPVEPPANDDPLLVAWRDPNHPAYRRIIINPHAAFYSVQGLMDMRTKGAFAIRCALLGQPIPNVVN